MNSNNSKNIIGSGSSPSAAWRARFSLASCPSVSVHVSFYDRNDSIDTDGLCFGWVRKFKHT